MFEIKVPQLGVNDQSAKIVEWLVADGGAIEQGQTICVLETTKVAFDLAADEKGRVIQVIKVGENIEIGQTIGLIGDNVSQLLKRKEQLIKDRPIKSKYLATDKAQELANQLGINLMFLEMSDVIIRENDVREFHTKILTMPIDRIQNFELVIYGAGRGGLNILETERWRVNCFVDDSHKTEFDGFPVYHSSKLPELYEQGGRNIFFAIANGRKRVELLEQLSKDGWNVINLLHPELYIAKSVTMGVGNNFKAGAVVDSNTVIGDCCIIDNNVTIPHDNIIGNGVHIAPGVTLGSSVTIGDYAIIGIGSSIATGIKIGAGAIIGVGAGVIHDVAEDEFVEGIPAHHTGKTGTLKI